MRQYSFSLNTIYPIQTAHLLWAALLYVVLIAGFGCGDSQDINSLDEQVYATVNGVHLTETDLRSAVPSNFYDRLTREHKQSIIDDWINQELLYQEAIHEGIDNEPAIRQLLDQSRKNLLSNEFLERRLNDIPVPGDEELQEFYEENEELFILDTNEYRVRYALFDNKRDADSFHRRVKQNESFSDLSQEFSKDPSSQQGGDIGIVNEELVEPAVWEGIISTRTKYGMHRISDPFTVVDGWACMIIDETLEAGTVKPFEYVRDLVLDMYMSEKREDARQELVEQLYDQADITMYPFTR